MRKPRRIDVTAPLLLAAGAAVLRATYVSFQPSFDPTFAAPDLDGAAYLSWARALLGDGTPPKGAYYLAPGYAFVLALLGWLNLASPWVVIALQHAAVLAAAVVLGRLAGRLAGPAAAWVATAAAALYHPGMFFASRWSAEAWSLAPLALAITLAHRQTIGAMAGAGALMGVATLFRPAFLLVVVAWAAGLTIQRRPAAVAALLAACFAILLPVMLRNLVISGHVVPVSSNFGITLYQGNGPGALGVYTPVDGLTGRFDTQRSEATRTARERSGLDLDDVEADRWWAREALSIRLGAPFDSAVLGVRRLLLTMSHGEVGLDGHPGIDPFPWRLAAPLPFAVLFGLALCGGFGAGWSRSGGWVVWSAVAALAAVPIVFYVSSRYRLPFAVVLSVPAGVGAAWIAAAGGSRRTLVRRVALAVAGIALSAAVPTFGLPRQTAATALANRANSWRDAGRVDRAVVDAERAVRLDPEDPWSRRALGAARGAEGDWPAAEEAYRAAWALDPSSADTAVDLGGILIRAGRPRDAVPFLRAALRRDPGHPEGWTNLVVALVACGSYDEANSTAQRAAERGIALDPALLEAVRDGTQ